MISILLIISSILQFIYGSKKNYALAFLCLIIAINFIKTFLWKEFYDNVLFLIFLGGVKEVFIGPLLLFHIRLKSKPIHTREILYHLTLPIIIYLIYIIKVIFFYGSHNPFNTEFYSVFTYFMFFHYMIYFRWSYIEYKTVRNLVIPKVSKTILLFLVFYIIPLLLQIVLGLIWTISIDIFPEDHFILEVVLKKWIVQFSSLIMVPINIISRLFIFLYAFIEIPFFKRFFYPKNILLDINAQENSNDIQEKIHIYFNLKKIYKNPKLTINECSAKLGCSEKELKDFLKIYKNTTFTKLLNEYRIQEFKSLLSDSINDIYDINSLAELAGFKSRATFYRIFKEVEGVTPTQYKSSVGN